MLEALILPHGMCAGIFLFPPFPEGFLCLSRFVSLTEHTPSFDAEVRRRR